MTIFPIACCPDTHFPFADRKGLMRFIAFCQLHQPKIIIQLGDLYDFFCFSRFPRTHDVMTPYQEITDGRLQAEDFWKMLTRACPEAKCYQLWGNHDIRPKKGVIAKMPELAAIVASDARGWLTQLMTFPGVETLPDDREALILGDTMFTHGYLTKPGDHAKKALMNVVHGHTHRASVSYFPHLGKGIWELDCGAMADFASVPMSYSKVKQINQWTRGWGWIDEHGPRYIPI